jgi:hypothetical protein
MVQIMLKSCKTTRADAMLRILVAIAAFTYACVAIAQPPDNIQRGERGTRVPALTPEQQQSVMQARRMHGPPADQTAPDAPSDEPKQSIALTVWVLTFSSSSVPEADELTGQLQDKASRLPASSARRTTFVSSLTA